MSILEVKKIIALCLCVLLATGVWIPHVNGNDKNSTTDTNPAWGVKVMGTRGEPLLIYDVNDLQNMRNDLSADYALANDIDATETKDWNDGDGFLPVGNDTNLFNGTFNGRGCTIRELFIDHPSTDYAGMFGAIGSSGSVTNVGLVDMDITGAGHTGGLVGYNEGTVSNCYATGSVNAALHAGGLVARNAGLVESSFAAVSLTGNTRVGGIVGSNSDTGIIVGSSATGSATGSERVGGIVGNNIGRVEKCYASVSVSGTAHSVGGFLGRNQEGTVENCYATGSVIRESGTETTYGGFVGHNNNGKIRKSYATGSVHYAGASDPTDKGFSGGISNWGNYVDSGNFWDKETSGQTTTSGEAKGVSTAEMMTRSTFTDAGWDFEDVWIMFQNTTYPLLLWRESPSAHAGPDRIVDMGTQVTLNGTASTDNVGIVNYTWTFNDGTGDIILYGGAPIHIFPVPGIVAVLLNVTDDVGLWDTDIVHITVLDIIPPSAHAGPDLHVNMGTLVTFNGTASTDNVGIVNYIWAFTHNGTAVTLHGASPTFQFWTPGVYTVTLVVTDAAGNTASDTRIVSVSSRDEQGWGIDDLWPIILILVIVIAAIAILVIRGRKKVSTPPNDQGWQQSCEQTLAQMAPEKQPFPEPMYAPTPLTAPPSPGGFPPAEFPPVPAVFSSVSVLPTPAFGRPSHDNAPYPPASARVWFCPKCGTKLEEKYVFCLDCGYRRGE